MYVQAALLSLSFRTPATPRFFVVVNEWVLFVKAGLRARRSRPLAFFTIEKGHIASSEKTGYMISYH